MEKAGKSGDLERNNLDKASSQEKREKGSKELSAEKSDSIRDAAGRRDFTYHVHIQKRKGGSA